MLIIIFCVKKHYRNEENDGDDGERSGRPKEVVATEIIDKIRGVILDYRKINSVKKLRRWEFQLSGNSTFCRQKLPARLKCHIPKDSGDHNGPFYSICFCSKEFYYCFSTPRGASSPWSSFSFHLPLYNQRHQFVFYVS